MDPSDICRNWQVCDFLFFGFIGDMAFIIAPLTEDDNDRDTEFKFLPGEYTTNTFELLQNVVHVGKVFAYESARIFGDHLIGAIGFFIVGDQTFCSYIINKQNGE
jgi:hypothetical protein